MVEGAVATTEAEDGADALQFVGIDLPVFINAREADTAARVRALSEQVGLSHRIGQRVQDLSGGERQRTAICRALMNAPRLLLADEPTGSLDEQTGDAIFALLRQLAASEGVAVVLATHERRFAEACDRLVRVRNGRLSEV